VKVVVNSHTTVIAGVYLIAKEGSYTPLKLAHNHTSLCMFLYQSYDQEVRIDTRDAMPLITECLNPHFIQWTSTSYLSTIFYYTFYIQQCV
jgi:hypothetical protein